MQQVVDALDGFSKAADLFSVSNSTVKSDVQRPDSGRPSHQRQQKRFTDLHLQRRGPPCQRGRRRRRQIRQVPATLRRSGASADAGKDALRVLDQRQPLPERERRRADDTAPSQVSEICGRHDDVIGCPRNVQERRLFDFLKVRTRKKIRVKLSSN